MKFKLLFCSLALVVAPLKAQDITLDFNGPYSGALEEGYDNGTYVVGYTTQGIYFGGSYVHLRGLPDDGELLGALNITVDGGGRSSPAHWNFNFSE